MTIDNNITNLGPGLDTLGVNQAAQTKQIGQTAVNGRGERGADSDGDQVHLSDFASQLSAQASSSDPGKLARLQSAYNSGTYNVSPAQIANSIISDAFIN